MGCLWCLESPESVAEAKAKALVTYSELKYHGFHCSLHAEAFHELTKPELDDNMRFSCCEHDILSGDSLAAMMAQLSLRED